MGSLFTKEKEELPSLVQSTLKVRDELSVKERPTAARNERDGRSYKEVVQAGPEQSSMSKLQEPGAVWEFCETPENGKVQVRERVQDEGGAREGTSTLRSVQSGGVQKQNQTTHEFSEM